jgi:hypothetical protein
VVHTKAKTKTWPQTALQTLKCFPCILVSYGAENTKLLFLPTAYVPCAICEIRMKCCWKGQLPHGVVWNVWGTWPT